MPTSAIVIRRPVSARRGVKPRGSIQIDWSHPLTKALAAYVPATEFGGLPFESVSRSQPDSGWVLTPDVWVNRPEFGPRGLNPGVHQENVAPGAAWSDALSRHAGLPTHTPLTAAMFIRQSSVAAAAHDHWGKRSAAGGWALGKNSGQDWNFVVNVGAGSHTAVTATNLVVNVAYFVVGRYDGAGFAGSVGGSQIEVRWVRLDTGETEFATGNVAGVPTDTTSALKFGERVSTNRCTMGVAAFWKRYLSDGEIDEWMDDPWCVLVEPSPRRRYVVIGAPEAAAPSVLSPSGIASEEAFGTAILQGAIEPSGIATAEAFGVHALVDANTTIAPSGIASGEAFGLGEVIDAAGAAGTITVGAGITSGEAFGTAVVQENATISPTGIPSAFDMDLHNVGVAVGTIAPTGIPSEEAFSQVATGGGINGGITVVTPTNPATPLAGTVTAKKLCSPIGLIRAEVVSSALDGAVILPDVYGDFSTGGLRGPCPAVLVNSTSPFIYVAAAHPVKEITNVYVDDVEQTSGFATVSAVDLGTGFQVAVIAFTTQPTGQVTWRGKGRMDDAQALITNPIEQLETLLKHRCGWHTEDFDATTLAEAKAAATAGGWSAAWVFHDDRQVQDWITEVMFNVMGFWRVSGRAQLQLTLDPGGATFPQSDLVDSIVASRDVVDGDDGVQFVADRQHLVNKLEAYYLYTWSIQQPASRLIDLEDELSINAYGELRKSVTLRGLRDSALVTTWADILFQRQSFGQRVEGATLNFAVKGSRLIHATVGDLIAFTWPYGPTRESGNAYVNQILRILAISHDFATGGIVQITAVDTGAYVLDGSTRLLIPLAL